jgi:serine/threonine protein kinase
MVDALDFTNPLDLSFHWPPTYEGNNYADVYITKWQGKSCLLKNVIMDLANFKWECLIAHRAAEKGFGPQVYGQWIKDRQGYLLTEACFPTLRPHVESVLDLIDQMHQHGIAHRDLQVQNFRQTAEGKLVITEYDQAFLFRNNRTPKPLRLRDVATTMASMDRLTPEGTLNRFSPRDLEIMESVKDNEEPYQIQSAQFYPIEMLKSTKTFPYINAKYPLTKRANAILARRQPIHRR